MRYFIVFLILVLPVVAQAEELYSETPKCAVLKNDTASNAFVALRTDFYTKPDGKRSYYESVVLLEPGKEREMCVKGPFFPDYKVTLSVKSFFPLFRCQTKLEGTIAVHEKRTGDNRTVWADCIN